MNRVNPKGRRVAGAEGEVGMSLDGSDLVRSNRNVIWLDECALPEERGAELCQYWREKAAGLSGQYK